VTLAGALVAISLLLLLALGVAGLFMAGSRSRDANRDEPAEPASREEGASDRRESP
jgi:hypothetical protein